MISIKRCLPLYTLPYKTFNRLRQTKTMQRLLLPFGTPLAPKRWIFIVGCYNSGTTLLARILAKHPEVGALPIEGVALTDSLPRPEEYGWPRMWCKCIDKVRLEPGPGMEKIAERVKRQWSIWYPRDRANLLEKSVANTARMPFLEEYFRPAYFIYIVRNGYAVAAGIREKANLRRWKNPIYDSKYPIELCAKQWRVTDEIVEKDSKQVSNFLMITYEELTEKPFQVLKQITDFLELPPLPEKVVNEHWKIDGVVSPIQNMNEISFTRLSREDVERITQVAKPVLEKYGYKAP